MRALYIPPAGQVSVIEEQGPWPVNEIMEFLHADPLYVHPIPQPNPDGRSLVIVSGVPARERHRQLLPYRPALIFASTEDEGWPVSLSKKELMFLGFLIALEEYLGAIRTPRREIE